MPRIFSLFFLVSLLAACAPAAPAPTQIAATPTATAEPTATAIPDVQVKAWLTTADQSQLLAPQPDLFFSAQPASGAKKIFVNEFNRYQTMDGFGAAMTDSSAWLLYTQLSAEQREKAMRALFSPTDGIGVSVIRVPMGASDFVNGDHYTYNDMPPGGTDPELVHFSIEHDLAYIVPAIRDALKLNPQLKIMVSPWSAPAWMKDSGQLGYGKLLPQHYPAYAQYFVKFIQAYKEQGIPVYAVTIQNEPHHEPHSYPGLRMEPAEMADFVKNHLGPAFQSASLETKILVWDHNWDEPDYPIEILDDPDAKAFIAGSAFHCYKGTVMAQGLVHAAHPDRDLYFTECSGGAWIPNFGEGFKRDMKDLLIGSPRYWAKTVLKWNLALDVKSGPHTGGCGNCYGFLQIDPALPDGFTPMYEYYAFGHASKFVAPEAYRIASTSHPYDGMESVAYLNPDGSKVLILANTRATEKEFAVYWGDLSFSYTLPGGAAATFTWSDAPLAARPPAPPTELSVKALAGKAVLTWEFSPTAETYTVKRAEVPGGPYTVIAEGIPLPEYFDASVQPGVSYSYVVSAVNGRGQGADSKEASLLP